MWTLTFFAKLEWLAPLLLRAMIGFSFFAVHGFGKVNPGGDWGALDAWDWGAGFAEKSKHPAILDYIAVWTEFLGGFALLAGLLTRWAALGLTTVMLYAALVHHAPDPFRAKELALTFAVGSRSTGCFSAGPRSRTDGLTPIGRERLGWGGCALSFLPRSRCASPSRRRPTTKTS